MTDITPDLSLADQAAAYAGAQYHISGPWLACPVVRLKTRFGLTLAVAEVLAQRLHDSGVWRLHRVPSGLACAEIAPPAPPEPT